MALEDFGAYLNREGFTQDEETGKWRRIDPDSGERETLFRGDAGPADTPYYDPWIQGVLGSTGGVDVGLGIADPFKTNTWSFRSPDGRMFLNNGAYYGADPSVDATLGLTPNDYFAYPEFGLAGNSPAAQERWAAQYQTGFWDKLGDFVSMLPAVGAAALTGGALAGPVSAAASSALGTTITPAVAGGAIGGGLYGGLSSGNPDLGGALKGAALGGLGGAGSDLLSGLLGDSLSSFLPDTTPTGTFPDSAIASGSGVTGQYELLSGTLPSGGELDPTGIFGSGLPEVNADLSTGIDDFNFADTYQNTNPFPVPESPFTNVTQGTGGTTLTGLPSGLDQSALTASGFGNPFGNQSLGQVVGTPPLEQILPGQTPPAGPTINSALGLGGGATALGAAASGLRDEEINTGNPLTNNNGGRDPDYSPTGGFGQTIADFLKNPLISGTGLTGANLLGSLLSYLQQQKQSDSLGEAAKQIAALNNPMNEPKRFPFQDAYKNLLLNPNSYNATPYAQGQQNLANQAFQANVSKYGPGGTQFTDYLKNFQNIQGQDFFKLADQYGMAGGFTQSPGGGGSAAANAFGQAATADANSLAGFGRLLANPATNAPTGVNPLTQGISDLFNSLGNSTTVFS